MHKLNLTMILCLLGVLAKAQDTDETLKPVAGNKNLEVQFTPLGNQVISINGIRVRKFKSETQAVRMNIFLGYSQESEITQQGINNNPELKDKYSALSINLRPGFEKHLAGTKRLSPYFGGEFDLAWQRTVEKSEREAGTDIVTDQLIDENGYFRVGVNAIAGFDFYVAKNLYLGTEIGYGLSYRKNSNIKVKSDADGFDEPDPVKRGGALNLGPNVNASIRLGYIF